MKPVWKGKTFVARVKKYETVNAMFASAKEAKIHSTAVLTSGEFILTCIFLGRRIFKEMILNITPEINICWLVAAILLDIEEKTCDSANT